MSWECAVCGTKEGPSVRVDAVCHHCGKLLCRDHRIEIADSAFASTLGRLGLAATHCAGCKRQHHAADIPLSRGEL